MTNLRNEGTSRVVLQLKSIRSLVRNTNKKGHTEMQEIHWLIVRIHPFGKSSGYKSSSLLKGNVELGKELEAVRACSPFICDASFIHEVIIT